MRAEGQAFQAPQAEKVELWALEEKASGVAGAGVQVRKQELKGFPQEKPEPEEP
ncbi:MAG: hypothetical protein QXS76_03795 [Candidatus Bathyarchaeia archaeon]